MLKEIIIDGQRYRLSPVVDSIPCYQDVNKGSSESASAVPARSQADATIDAIEAEVFRGGGRSTVDMVQAIHKLISDYRANNTASAVGKPTPSA